MQTLNPVPGSSSYQDRAAEVLKRAKAKTLLKAKCRNKRKQDESKSQHRRSGDCQQKEQAGEEEKASKLCLKSFRSFFCAAPVL